MNSNFNNALQYALTKEMAQYEDLNNPYDNYMFSTDFENNIQKIITASEYSYVSIGSKRIKKSLIAVIIALFIIATTGCAVISHYIITWNENHNGNRGTLDVLFEREKNVDTSSFSYPKIPAGFKIINKYKDSENIAIEYTNAQNETIIYSQYNDIENMSVSIDNETSEFNEISINNYKGYSYTKDSLNILYWTDDTHFFTLQGTCKMSTLKAMAESTIQGK